MSKISRAKHYTFRNYARMLIYDGKIERYNRTSQEECIDPNLTLLFENITRFNHELANWLFYYNIKRPHFQPPRPKLPRYPNPTTQSLHKHAKIKPRRVKNVLDPIQGIDIFYSILYTAT